MILCTVNGRLARVKAFLRSLMKRWGQVHTHGPAIKVGPKGETVASPTQQEQLRILWVGDLRAEGVQHQGPGYGVLEGPQHKCLYQTGAELGCRAAHEVWITLSKPNSTLHRVLRLITTTSGTPPESSQTPPTTTRLSPITCAE